MDLSSEGRAVGLITAINVAVFAVFKKVPSMQRFMVYNFVHALPPLPLRARTLLTSNFTHQSGTHLLLNSLAFWSFGTEAARILGVDQFVAFYLSAGLASGLLSQIGRLQSLTGGFSVGASGAIYACFALTAITRPDKQVVVIFLPFLPVQIGDALAITVSLDCLGALLGWRTLDHFGHLGGDKRVIGMIFGLTGALFGMYYVFRGQHELWPKFQTLAERLSEGWRTS